MPNEDGTLKDDVVIGDYKRPWDAKPEARILAPGIPPASLWAYDPNGLNQVGCIYTAQGFEFDYVGVIFGEDLVYDFDKQEWVGDQSKSSDSVVKRSADKFIDLVKHTYRVLLSRGMKGCYVYFMNKDTERFFKSRIEIRKDIDKEKELKFSDVIKEEPAILARILADIKEEERFNEYLPVYSLAAAAGKFGENMDVQEEGWLKVDITRKLNNKMFIAKVVGHSMEPLISDNSYCIFSSDVVGSRQGKIVLVQHHSIHDLETGGSYTVKKYTSKKKYKTDGTWEHEEIVLEPINKAYEPILISPEQATDFKVIAEFVDVIKSSIFRPNFCTGRLNFIRKDESILWDAVEDFLKRSTINAASSVRGVYIFDLLTIDIHKEIKTFKHAELTAVIINVANKLAPGEIKMIKYSSVYALIHKTVASDWGKITFKTAVDVFKDKPDYLDILIKQLLKDYIFSHDPVVLLLNDLSLNPIFDLGNEIQQTRIKKVITNFIPNSIEFIPEVYIQDKNGARELLCGAKLW
jgi:phage repressor protein C with HTH and peptisase S24 domain